MQKTGRTRCPTPARYAEDGTWATQLSLLDDPHDADYLSDEDLRAVLETVVTQMSKFGDDVVRAARHGLYRRPMVDVNTGAYL